ncbi:trypco2 family protein [Streptomyces sp. NPDC015171]|uniref:trypco2 family protein n=1 Tax=Streptomyces sp. NPDC015171 TaxID=3364945 RepID=UPI0037025DFF
MIELTTVIKDLREELEQAVTAGVGKALRFELGTIELEVSLALEKKAGTSGKVRFWVVDLGADGSVSSNAVQRVKLSLSPTLDVAGVRTSAFVSGEEGTVEQ